MRKQENKGKQMQSCYYQAKLHIMDALVFGITDYKTLENIAREFIPPISCKCFIKRVTLSLINAAQREMLDSLIVYN